MKSTPFYDLTVHPDSNCPGKVDRHISLKRWAAGDLSHFAVAFIAYDGSPEDEDNYKFQIGYPVKIGASEILVVSEQSILDCEKEVYAEVNLRSSEDEDEVLFHVEQYMLKIKRIPIWGTREYHRLDLLGKTFRILQGPHKGSSTPKRRSRKIILDRGEMVFGPLI